MKTRFYSLGAAEEVTGSKHILEFNNQKIMVDCGAFQGKRDESEAKNRDWKVDATTLNAVVLTHAHFDHSGMIPLLRANGYEQNIYATPATRDLASLIMMDSAHIQQKDMEYLRKKAAKKQLPFDKKPIYVEQDVVKSLEQFVTISYNREFYIADGVMLKFIDAGHILGSAIPILTLKQGAEEIKIAVGGDWGRKNLPIISDPDPLPELDYLVLESTYGNRLHDPIEQTLEKLMKIVNDTYQRGGKIIIPAFAIERTQELVFYLHLLTDEKKIPKIPIYVDSPMATNATSIFRVHQECYDQETRDIFINHHQNPFGFNELHFISSVEESKALNELREPAIIISSSGMCEAGRILHHLANNIYNPRNTILIVGFMAQNTLGRRIVEKAPQVKIFDEIYPLKAHVEVLNTFSGHADYLEILSQVNQLDPNRLKRIFLVHGEPDAQAHLKGLLEEKGLAVTIVKYGESYELN